MQFWVWILGLWLAIVLKHTTHSNPQMLGFWSSFSIQALKCSDFLYFHCIEGSNAGIFVRQSQKKRSAHIARIAWIFRLLNRPVDGRNHGRQSGRQLLQSLTSKSIIANFFRQRFRPTTGRFKGHKARMVRKPKNQKILLGLLGLQKLTSESRLFRLLQSERFFPKTGKIDQNLQLLQLLGREFAVPIAWIARNDKSEQKSTPLNPKMGPSGGCNNAMLVDNCRFRARKTEKKKGSDWSAKIDFRTQFWQ